MQLEKTVDMMLSDDPAERLKAEYQQTVYRRNKLQKYIKEAENEGVHRDLGSMVMLRWQLRVMDDYIFVLKERAKANAISLK